MTENLTTISAHMHGPDAKGLARIHVDVQGKANLVATLIANIIHNAAKLTGVPDEVYAQCVYHEVVRGSGIIITDELYDASALYNLVDNGDFQADSNA